ncbi:MAG: PilZ domain-containing protein [gamma proteobacterium symbiont of Lucinoma myriamae]|nr:PilZ domain-containing protein [gamma proteobacterium symbiont of Lucinoma myriamae]MCU7818447.1 PilZ domain-containing protein [gamma proteobacterium symbiont of Lucinoma myriamae]MCU7832356.1 PilZ domain-containing protein [gamma proteobacterium symbiont of Lucinoma myriamae]
MKARKFTRYATDIPVSIAIDHMLGKHQLYLKDISQGGLSFKAHGCIDRDTHLDIVISCSGQSHNASGKIAWSQSLETGQCQLGIMFEKQVTQSEIEKMVCRH